MKISLIIRVIRRRLTFSRNKNRVIKNFRKWVLILLFSFSSNELIAYNVLRTISEHLFSYHILLLYFGKYSLERKHSKYKPSDSGRWRKISDNGVHRYHNQNWKLKDRAILPFSGVFFSFFCNANHVDRRRLQKK